MEQIAASSSQYGSTQLAALQPQPPSRPTAVAAAAALAVVPPVMLNLCHTVHLQERGWGSPPSVHTVNPWPKTGRPLAGCPAASCSPPQQPVTTCGCSKSAQGWWLAPQSRAALGGSGQSALRPNWRRR